MRSQQLTEDQFRQLIAAHEEGGDPAADAVLQTIFAGNRSAADHALTATWEQLVGGEPWKRNKADEEAVPRFLTRLIARVWEWPLTPPSAVQRVA